MQNSSEKHVSTCWSNTVLAEVQTYFVQYDWVGHERHCQVAARSEKEARDIFQGRFDFCCRIVKIQTAKDIENINVCPTFGNTVLPASAVYLAVF